MSTRYFPVNKFNTLSFQALCDYSKGVTLSLISNPALSAPPISTADLNTADDAMQSAILAWGPRGNRGSKAQHQALKDAAKVVRANLHVLADYVDSVAQGDASIILSSGMNLSGTPFPLGQLLAPANFRRLTKQVASGQTPLKWISVRGASAYNVYAAASPTDPFVLIATVTQTSFTGTGTPGRLSYYTVRAIGAAGLGIETAALPAHSSF